MKRTRYIIFILSILIISIVGNAQTSAAKPESVIKKMVKAYGGKKGVEKVQSFTGVGFIKDLSSKEIARSDPFDIFRQGMLYKHKRFKVVRGIAKDVSVVIYDGKEGYEWRYSGGRNETPSWEYYILKYKFPVVLKWIQENLTKVKSVENNRKEHLYIIDFADEDNLLSLYIDDKDWLLRRTELRSKTDSSFSYSEEYSDYRDVGKIPFPSRFTGYYKGNKYYEFFLPTINIGVNLPDSTFRINASDTENIRR